MKLKRLKLWKKIVMMALSLVVTAFMVLAIGGKVSATELTVGTDGNYHLTDSTDYTLTVYSSMAASGSSWIIINVVADNEGNLTYPPESTSSIYNNTKHLSKDEQFQIQLDKNNYNGKTITLKFEAVHTHDWDSSTGKCKTCGAACTHDFSKGDEWCTICKWRCPHEKKTATGYSHSSDTKHKVTGKCDLCGKTDLDMGEEDCAWELESSNKTYGTDGSSAYHKYTCSKCKWTKTEDCSFDKVISTTSSGPETHTVKTQCKCGNYYVKDVSHKWSGNKCSECGFVRVQPGKIKGLKFKQLKAVKKRGYHKGWWDAFHRWNSGYYYTYYKVTYKVTFKKVKNAKYYEITYRPDSSTNDTTKKIKSGGKITLNLGKSGNTFITLDAVSKTGNKSSYTKNFKYKIK